MVLPIFDQGVRRGWVVSATPRPLYPEKMTRCPFYRKLCAPRDRSRWFRKLSSQRGSNPWPSSP